MDKHIFTFWEPQTNIPEYLKLCMQTWEKFLPEYKIIVLDYKNIDKWLEKDFFDKTLYKYYSLPQQADAIRCALLEKYGGIWLDTDTIITSKKIKDLLDIDSDFILFGDHIGFIKAKKHTYILQQWLKGIKRNLTIYKYFRFLKKILKLKEWDYLGNKILAPLLMTEDKNTYYEIDKYKNNIFPELKIFCDIPHYDAYQKFYFESDYSQYVTDNTGGIILLHNSWTPPQYKNLSKQEILNTNNTISKLLKNILNY